MSATPKDTLGGATKGDIQKAVAIGFLGIFGVAFLYIFFSGQVNVNITGTIDANTFVGPLIGIIIGIFSWLGFKAGTGK